MNHQIHFLMTFILCILASPSFAQGSDNKTTAIGEVDVDVLPNDQGVEGPHLQAGCVDWQGHRVEDGEKYIPSAADVCTKCTCDKTFPVRCHSVACSPPHHCSSPRPLAGQCCEYVCMDGDDRHTNGSHPGGGDGSGDGESITNLSLRLIASTVTSFLVLALLLFMVHRLRQRRLLLAMRRFEARSQQVHSEDTDSEPYIPEMFMSVECPPYTDPPPPYSPPKPPQILPGEQPPPYDQLSQHGDANGNSAQENRNQVALSPSQSRGCDQVPGGSVRPLTELAVSERGVVVGEELRSAQRETLNAHCRESSGPRGREDVQVDGQRLQQRPACPDVYSAEIRRDRAQLAGDSRTSARGCVSYSLPAYACTDVVGCLGVVLSPGDNQASYAIPAVEPAQYPGASRWSHCSVHERQQQGRSSGRRNINATDSVALDRCEAQPRHRRREGPSARGSNHRIQTLPTITAFQRFSNLFKRNSWRAKNLRRPQNLSSGSGVSELQPNTSTAQYSTLPGGEPRVPHSSNLYAGFDLSACNFYPTTASSSTSSSNSSSGGDNIGVHQLPQLGDVFHPSVPNTSHHVSSSARNISVPYNTVSGSEAAGSAGTSNRNVSKCDESYQREQFQDDLRRHLPRRYRQSADFSSSQNCTGSLPVRPMTCYADTSQAEGVDQESHVLNHTQESALGSSFSTTQQDCRNNPNYAVAQRVSPQPSTQSHQRKPSDPQRSLASFICSNLSVATAAHSQREHSTVPHSQPGSIVFGNKDNQSATEMGKPESPVVTDNCTILSTNEPSSIATGSHYQPTHLRSTSAPSSNNHPPLNCFNQTSSSLRAHQKPVFASATAASDMCQEQGAIRRSHSDTSEGSLFSICSETGEQKLKATRHQETAVRSSSEARALPADCPYPQHPSLESSYKPPLACSHSDSSSAVVGVQGCDNGARVTQTVLKSEAELGACGGSSACSDWRIGGESVPEQTPHPVDSPVNIVSQSEALSRDYSTCSGSAHEPDYNLNTSPHTRKRLASKDLLPVVGEDRMVKSVNIPPCYLSGYSLEETSQKTEANPSLPDLQEAIAVRKSPVKIADNPKKQRRKKSNARSSSPVSFYHGGARQKNFAPTQEKMEPSQRTHPKDQEKDLKTGRGGSKRRLHQGPFQQPPLPEFCAVSENQLMSKSTGDASLQYGNADVYRGSVHPALEAAYHLTREPGDVINIGLSDSRGEKNALSGLNDLNQPPRKLREVSERDGHGNTIYPSDAAITLIAGSNQGGGQQLKKKGGHLNRQNHRRQASAGAPERAGALSVSPSRRKPRPKSLAAPSETGIHDITQPRQAPEVYSASRGGARSGFGRDMNLDDENGVADFHIHSSAPSYPQKNMFGYASVVGTSAQLSSVKQAWKPEDCSNYPVDVGVTRGPQWTASHGLNSSSRSGPSKDLSFVGRSSVSKEKSSGHQRNKKRQSLPAFAIGSNWVGESDCFSKNDVHEPLPQSRINGMSRTLSEEDVREATSYV